MALVPKAIGPEPNPLMRDCGGESPPPDALGAKVGRTGQDLRRVVARGTYVRKPRIAARHGPRAAGTIPPPPLPTSEDSSPAWPKST